MNRGKTLDVKNKIILMNIVMNQSIKKITTLTSQVETRVKFSKLRCKRNQEDLGLPKDGSELLTLFMKKRTT